MRLLKSYWLVYTKQHRACSRKLLGLYYHWACGYVCYQVGQTVDNARQEDVCHTEFHAQVDRKEQYLRLRRAGDLPSRYSQKLLPVTPSSSSRLAAYSMRSMLSTEGHQLCLRARGNKLCSPLDNAVSAHATSVKIRRTVVALEKKAREASRTVMAAPSSIEKPRVGLI